MTIILKDKATLVFDDFIFRCAIGVKGITKKKVEGDKKTPIGTFSLGNLYYRKDRNIKPLTKLKCIPIKNNMGWCDDVNSKKYYNKLIKINKKIRYEKLFRKDNKYDYFIIIKYNTDKIIRNRGSAIFLHLTKNYKSTAGCIAVKKKDFLIILKFLNRNSKIKIY